MRYQLLLSTSDIFTKFCQVLGPSCKWWKNRERESGSLVQDAFTHKIRSTQLDWRRTATLNQSRETLNSWKGRGLTLIGKIQVVKSFTIPKFLNKAALISVPEDQVKEISKLIYHFIWKGNDKIKRSALINDINDGGLKMLDIHSIICAQRVMVLKNYADEENHSSWKITLDYSLSGVVGKFILHCNFDTRKLPIYLLPFYKECLDAWSHTRTWRTK